MPNFDSPASDQPIKLLYLGHSGAGKTGSLCSLAAAGYNLRIADIDNGCEIIRDYVQNPESPYLKPQDGLWSAEQIKSIRSRISYVPLGEQHKIKGAKAIPTGQAWQKIMNLLNNWTDGDLKLGNIATWTRQDVLVIDSLSRLAEAAMNFHLALNGRLERGPQVGTSGDNDYTQVYRLITDFLDFVKCEEIKCNVIMIGHIQFQSEFTAAREAGNKPQFSDIKGFPQTIGKLIAPKIPQYFNHSLRAKSIGTGPSTKRVIVPNNDESIELKTPIPLRVKKEYPLTTGLAEYFSAVRSTHNSPGRN